MQIILRKTDFNSTQQLTQMCSPFVNVSASVEDGNLCVSKLNIMVSANLDGRSLRCYLQNDEGPRVEIGNTSLQITKGTFSCFVLLIILGYMQEVHELNLKYMSSFALHPCIHARININT